MKLFPRQREAAIVIADGAEAGDVMLVGLGWGRASGKTITLRAARLLLAVRRGRAR